MTEQATREREVLDKAGLETKQADIFVVDWDGVCCEAVWPAWGNWLPGAIEGLKELLLLGRVRIYSSRLNPYKFGLDGIEKRDPREVENDIGIMRCKLDFSGLSEVEIHTTHGKPTGTYYIDDRAIEFKGSWYEVLQRIDPIDWDPADQPTIGGVWSVAEAAARSKSEEAAGMRSFNGGATRNTDTNKEDYEGFLSPRVLRAFGRYMHSHRKQKDGSTRSSDNWQKGIPLEVYMKSAWRHFFDLWDLHRGGAPLNPDTNEPVSFEEALMGLLFNVQGFAHEKLKEEEVA